jgi:hypothetical protein
MHTHDLRGNWDPVVFWFAFLVMVAAFLALLAGIVLHFLA